MAFAYSFNGNSRALLHALNQKSGTGDPVLTAAGAAITEIINTFPDGTFLLVDVSGDRASGGAGNTSPEPATLTIKVTPVVLSAGTILVSKADEGMKAAQADADARARQGAYGDQRFGTTDQRPARPDNHDAVTAKAQADAQADADARNAAHAQNTRATADGPVTQAEDDRRAQQGAFPATSTIDTRPTNYSNGVEAGLTDADLKQRAEGTPWPGQGAAIDEINRRRGGAAAHT